MGSHDRGIHPRGTAARRHGGKGGRFHRAGRHLHPAILAKGGLPPALAALARRSTVPVRLDVQVPDRPPSRPRSPPTT
jgi:hypothetical protein